MKDLVFIILRCVTNKQNNDYWTYSYNCIEKFHPGTDIYIIDDYSTYTDENTFNEKYNIIKSEFKPGRGEILGYYYFHKLKLAKKAIIIHDSVFINTHIKYKDVENFRLFWNFNGRARYDIFHTRIKEIMGELKVNYSDLEKFQWKGAFGLMSIIEYNFIDKINNHTNIFEVLINQAEKKIGTSHHDRRMERIAVERVIGYLFYKFNNNTNCNPYFGDIYQWIQLLTGKNKDQITYSDWHDRKELYQNVFTIMKIFTGR